MKVHDQALETLFDGTLIQLKKTDENPDEAFWNFAGIASDETEDIEGDKLLKAALDLTYAKKRGFVNWNHSRDPGDQIGYLTKCQMIEGNELADLGKSLGVELKKTASIYVEGRLYKFVPKALEVRNLLKSAEVGYNGGLGLSVDGMMAKSADGGVIKAFVRGVAMTPAPAHTSTLCHLKKTLREFQIEGMTMKDAIKWCLDKRPQWTEAMAVKFVQFASSISKKGVPANE